jgi:hypothetical protein
MILRMHHTIVRTFRTDKLVFGLMVSWPAGCLVSAAITITTYDVQTPMNLGFSENFCHLSELLSISETHCLDSHATAIGICLVTSQVKRNLLSMLLTCAST